MISDLILICVLALCAHSFYPFSFHFHFLSPTYICPLSVIFSFSSNFFPLCCVCYLSCFVHSLLMFCPLSFHHPLSLCVLSFTLFSSHHLPASLIFPFHPFLYLASCTIFISLSLSPPQLILLSHSSLL